MREDAKERKKSDDELNELQRNYQEELQYYGKKNEKDQTLLLPTRQP